MTAVFVPEGASRFVRAEPPAEPAAGSSVQPTGTAADVTRSGRRGPGRRTEPSAAPAAPVTAAEDAPAAPVTAAEDAPPVPSVGVAAAMDVAPEGFVLFAVAGTTFAVDVAEVREIVRAVRFELLPQVTAAYGHGVALVDVRGRSIPVVDLRADRAASGDVLLPMWRHQVGLVVDHVVAVSSRRELETEQEQAPAALPSYARAVLRPADGGAPVLLIRMPDADELAADAERVDKPKLGQDVLGAEKAG